MPRTVLKRGTEAGYPMVQCPIEVVRHRDGGSIEHSVDDLPLAVTTKFGGEKKVDVE